MALGDAVTGFEWNQFLLTSGPNVAGPFGTTSTVTATFSAGGNWQMRLVVRDTHNATSEGTATRTLYVNRKPTSAIAGYEFTPTVGETMATEGLSIVKLTSASLDADGNYPLTYTWNVTDSGGTHLANVTDVAPTYTPDCGGTQTAYLWVKDSYGAPSAITDRKTFVVNWRPTAAVSPVQSTSSSWGETKITSGLSTIILQDGSQDTEGGTLSYWWEAKTPGGDVAPISTATSRNPSFTPTCSGVYGVSHTVRDNYNAPAPTTPSCYVPVNARPRSVLQPPNVVSSTDGETMITVARSRVVVSGTASTDPDPGDASGLTYQWWFHSPDGGLFATATGPTATLAPTGSIVTIYQSGAITNPTGSWNYNQSVGLGTASTVSAVRFTMDPDSRTGLCGRIYTGDTGPYSSFAYPNNFGGSSGTLRMTAFYDNIPWTADDTIEKFGYSTTTNVGADFTGFFWAPDTGAYMWNLVHNAGGYLLVDSNQNGLQSSGSDVQINNTAQSNDEDGASTVYLVQGQRYALDCQMLVGASLNPSGWCGPIMTKEAKEILRVLPPPGGPGLSA